MLKKLTMVFVSLLILSSGAYADPIADPAVEQQAGYDSCKRWCENPTRNATTQWRITCKWSCGNKYPNAKRS